jgi:hypothetical protein
MVSIPDLRSAKKRARDAPSMHRYTYALAVGVLTASCSGAEAQTPASPPATETGVTADPRHLEGLWLSKGGGPPPDAAHPAAPPPLRPLELSGSTLQCAPVERLGAAGGGMSTLILQSPTQIVLISEEDMDVARKIYMGARHPANPLPQPNGHSVGHWEGNLLVVDTVAYSDKEGKDRGQHVVEHITRQDNVLVDDATISQRDGTTSQRQLRWIWRPDLQFNENVCEEGFDRYEVVDGKLDNPNTAPARPKSK